tara:strand:- start:4941 stop:5891 length:951 start_codon:yes stop_codon:yes gene_type:complete
MTRQKQVLRVGYITQKYQITDGDIRSGKFEILTNRRNIAKSTVNSIFDGLINNKHFDSSFVVNKDNGKFRLIDGNHRYEAIVKYLAANPENRVEVTLHVYKELDEDEEKILYTLYNQGRKQNTNDFVQQYKDEIPFWKIVINPRQFPMKVSVYGGINSISFYKLVGAYISCRKARFTGGYFGKPLDFIEDSKQLGHSDAKLLAEFIKEHLKAFGPLRNNKWFRTTPFTAIMKIWIDNRDNFTPDKIVKLFQERIAMDAEAIDLGSSGGQSATKYARDKYLIKLNNGRQRDIFVDRDTQEEPDEAELEAEMEDLPEK